MRSRITGIMAAATLVLTACGAATSGSTATTTQPPPTQPSTTAAAPTTASYGKATYVSGTISGFDISEGTVTTDSDGSSHGRGGSVTYQLVSDDPRVSGQVSGTWNSDRWGTQDNGALVQWGEVTLTNSKGSWVASYAGAYAAPVGDMINRWWVGTGAYQGLTFFCWMQVKDFSDPTSQWYGVIYPGTPPPGARGK